MISAIIVEDEKKGMESLLLKLGKHCPEVVVVGKCKTGESAVEEIRRQKPQLIFLDIELGTMTGFDVLDQLKPINFEIIFTTSYNQYTIDAIRASAVDYLLKPIKPDELIHAVQVVQTKIINSGTVKRIAVPISDGFQLITIDDIMYCQADDNCTRIHLTDGRMVFVTRTLLHIQKKLPRCPFIRVHRGYLVNCDYVESFHRGAGGYLRLSNGKEFSVGDSRRDELLDCLTRMSGGGV